MIKSNPTPARWAPFKWEKNTKEVLAQLWRFWAPRQASHPGDPANGLAVPRESELEVQRDWIAGFPQDWRKQTLLLQDTGKTWCAPGTRGKEQWAHRRLSQTYLWVLEALLRRWGLAVACHGNRDTGSSSPGRRPLAWALLEIAVSPTIEPVDSRAESPQAKQLTWKEPSPSADNWISVLLTMVCPPEGDPIFSAISSSHQEACLLALSTRGQTNYKKQARRTTIPQPPKWKAHRKLSEWKSIGLSSRWKNKINPQRKS